MRQQRRPGRHGVDDDRRAARPERGDARDQEDLEEPHVEEAGQRELAPQAAVGQGRCAVPDAEREEDQSRNRHDDEAAREQVDGFQRPAHQRIGQAPGDPDAGQEKTRHARLLSNRQTLPLCSPIFGAFSSPPARSPSRLSGRPWNSAVEPA